MADARRQLTEIETAAASLFITENNGGAIVDPTKDDKALNYYATFKRTDNKIGVPKDLQTYAAARALTVQLKDDAENLITYVIDNAAKRGRSGPASRPSQPWLHTPRMSWRHVP